MVYKRTTNKERRLPVIRETLKPDGTVEIARHKEPLVLVGFGKQDLVDFIGYPQLMNEAFVKNWPPRYRKESGCSREEIELFGEFTKWLTELATKSKGK